MPTGPKGEKRPVITRKGANRCAYRQLPRRGLFRVWLVISALYAAVRGGYLVTYTCVLGCHFPGLDIYHPDIGPVVLQLLAVPLA